MTGNDVVGGSPNDDELIRHHRTEDGVDVLTLAHGKVNALCVELLDQLFERATFLASGPLDREGNPEAPRAVVVTGGPKVFAAGADITEFAERGGEAPFALSGPERVGEIGGAFLRALEAVAALPCPTIAAVNGFALGGGCELALACDFRVAAGAARVGPPEILLGIIPGGGGTQRLARLVGPARAKDLVFSGRMVDAEGALAMGLVDEVVEGDAVEAALARAARYARGPREATALAKQAVDGGLEGSLAEGLRLEQRLFVDSFGTADARVGVESFLEHGPGKARFD
jgi:enoyl-CoA hydratase/carnithine racemase